MIFPIYIKFNFQIDSPNYKNNKVLEYIEQEFRILKVDTFTKQLHRTDFKNSFFNGQGRTHIFGPIDSGYFECLNQKVTILFATKRLALIALTFALSIVLFSHAISLGIIAFLWIYGMNILIFLIRGYFLIKRLKKEINNIPQKTDMM